MLVEWWNDVQEPSRRELLRRAGISERLAILYGLVELRLLCRKRKLSGIKFNQLVRHRK